MYYVYKCTYLAVFIKERNFGINLKAETNNVHMFVLQSDELLFYFPIYQMHVHLWTDVVFKNNINTNLIPTKKKLFENKNLNILQGGPA